MAKVHPHRVHTEASTSSEQESFTLWMKSLILSSNGCVVFDSDGKIICRVDNYDRKGRKIVYIMDALGKILFTVKKRFSVLGLWEGYRSSSSNTGKTTKKEKPGFRMRKVFGIRMIKGFLRGYSYYKVGLGQDKNQYCEYLMENQFFKSSCRITDALGGLVAEVKRKVTTSGVALGEDVLTLVVEPNVDHCIVVGLVVVLGLIQHRL